MKLKSVALVSVIERLEEFDSQGVVGSISPQGSYALLDYIAYLKRDNSRLREACNWVASDSSLGFFDGAEEEKEGWCAPQVVVHTDDFHLALKTLRDAAIAEEE